jgi:hypothetical protein
VFSLQVCVPKFDVVFLVYLFIYLFAQGLLNDTVGSLDYSCSVVLWLVNNNLEKKK